MTTTPSREEAESLADAIIESKLAACVQILPQMTSVYVWEGEVQHENEHLLLIKTLEGRYQELESFIRANHSYDVPEIAAIRAENVSDGYRKWLVDVLGSVDV